MRSAIRSAVRRRGVILCAAGGLMVVLVSYGLASGGMLAPAGQPAGEFAAAEPAGSSATGGAPLVAPVPGDLDSRSGPGMEFDQSTEGLDAAKAGPSTEPSAGSPIGEAARNAAPSTGVMAGPSPRTSRIAPPVPVPVPVPVPPAPSPPPASTAPVDIAPDRLIVRTARLGLTVADLPAVSATVRDAAASVGGYVASENTVDKSATFTVRVPSARLDEVMGRLAAAGTVTERYGQADDVTDQMVDVQSRLATQQISVARMRALLARATTVGEVVSVESELTAREADLESLQRRLAAVSGRVELSTLTVSLAPAQVAAPPPTADGFLAGLAAGWRAFAAAASGTLTALGAALPFLVAIAVLGGFVLLGRRALRRHRAATAALAAVAGGEGSR